MTSTSNLVNFKPTYLYIKQHSITGLLYFGKTSYSDPIKYLGSGTHWQNHINKYGDEHVVTLWHELFTNRDELIQFAIQFSKDLNIVKSKSWANLKEENGLDGGLSSHSEETKLKMSATRKGRKGILPSSATRQKMSDSAKGRIVLDATRTKISATKTGYHHAEETKRKLSETIICPHCHQIGGKSAMKQWHFDNCRLKANNSVMS